MKTPKTTRRVAATEEERREKRLASYRRCNLKRKAEGKFTAYYAKTEVREKIKAQRNARYAADPQRYIAYQVKYAEKYPDRVAARLKRWKRANPDAVKRHERTKYERHRDKIIARVAKWNKSHPEASIRYRLKPGVRQRNGARSMAWSKANPQRKRMYFFRQRYGGFAEAWMLVKDTKRELRKRKNRKENDASN